MLKGLTIVASVVLGLSIYVAIQSQRATERASQQAAQPSNSEVASGTGNNQPQGSAKRPSRNLPGWYGFFAWPDGMTTWAILLTLFAIAWQSNETKKAAEAALRQADLMKEQSALVVGKERAKLRIDLNPFNPFPASKGPMDYVVEGSVSIYGYSEAFIERSEIYASIGEEGILSPLPEWLFPMHLPPVILSGAAPVKFRTLVNASDGPATDEEIRQVREKKASIFCVATIEFSDAFGQRWVPRLRRRFCFLWKPESRSDAEILGVWEDDGLPEQNGEYRQGQQHRPKPN